MLQCYLPASQLLLQLAQHCDLYAAVFLASFGGGVVGGGTGVGVAGILEAFRIELFLIDEKAKDG
ncbi:hypothetical protein D3C73_1672930 [compost metagenome]